MTSTHSIVTVNFIESGKTLDFEIPLDISAVELCSVLFEKYLPDRYGDVRRYYLKAERPIALLRGEKTLREYGIRDGSIINITN